MKRSERGGSEKAKVGEHAAKELGERELKRVKGGSYEGAGAEGVNPLPPGP